MIDAPAAVDFDSAYYLLAETLNAVEDEMTSIPFDPSAWQTDGRLYPPQADNARTIPDHPEVIRFRSLGHNTLIRSNGAIAIHDLRTGETIFHKRGADGCDVWGERPENNNA